MATSRTNSQKTYNQSREVGNGHQESCESEATVVNNVTHSCGRTACPRLASAITGRDQVEDAHFVVEIGFVRERTLDVAHSFKNDGCAGLGVFPSSFKGPQPWMF